MRFLQAAVLGKEVEIALDMGEPVRIRDLAEQMIRLAGKSSEGDIPIIYTGLRPGENSSRSCRIRSKTTATRRTRRSSWLSRGACHGAF